jgi:hypothetical protein
VFLEYHFGFSIDGGRGLELIQDPDSRYRHSIQLLGGRAAIGDWQQWVYSVEKQDGF